MMAEMAKCDFINRLIFVNPLSSIRTLFRKNNNLHTSSNITSNLFPSKINPKIWIYTPLNILPYRKYLYLLKEIETKVMLKIIKQLNSDMPYILFMNCPNIFLHTILDELLKKTQLSIFDLSDDFVELGYRKETKELFGRNITKYAQAADIVLTVNEHVRKKYRFLNGNIHVIRNATNYSNFDRKSYNPIVFLDMIKSNKKPIIGYSGIASMSRIDSNLLGFLLEKRQDWQFVFVGPAKSDFKERYLHYNNFHHLPHVDYQILPDYLRYFDVAIVPFKINEHTRGNDLLKFHDFLAMGKPVVTTEVGGATDLADVVKIAQNPSEFLNLIEKALLNESKEDILHRKKCAQKNSWSERIVEFTDLLQSYL